MLLYHNHDPNQDRMTLFIRGSDNLGRMLHQWYATLYTTITQFQEISGALIQFQLTAFPFEMKLFFFVALFPLIASETGKFKHPAGEGG